ncbi:MAG TPA: tyrosine-type recombinase/integrase [Thermohalobaculum sp.]|nr:tyrosine-type recombinase/integrase [Thermohalobaculum sp.]
MPGTFEALIREYRRSPKFANLAPITRRNLTHEMEWLRQEVGDLPFVRFELRHVEALMAKKADRPTAANKIRKLLSRLFRHAIRTGQATHNPASAAETYKQNPDGFHTWTDAEVETFRDRWPSGTPARLALELALNTGAARQDLARLGWQNITGDRIAYTRGKTGVSADLPVIAELAAELRHVPRDRLLFLTHSGGRPYTPESLGNWFKDRTKTRAAGATRAANAGATENEIAAILAHKDTRQASTYTRKADRTRLGDSAFEKVERAKGKHTVSNLPRRLDKSGGK